jgi:hypothetical protein
MEPMHAKLASLALTASVGAGIAGLVTDLAGVRSLFVTVLVLIFIAVAPTTAIAGLLRGFDLFARLVLTCVTSIVVITLIAMIMLAMGVWSPKAGLVAIALVSGACLLAQHAGPTMNKIAERAEPLRQAMIDYCVAFGGDRTATWAQTRTAVEPGTAGDTAVEPGTAAETAVEPGTAGDTAVEPGTAAETAVEPGTAGDTAVEPGTAAETAVEPGNTAGQHSHVTVTAEPGTKAADRKLAASNGAAEEMTGDPEAVAADSVAGKPSRFRDTA